MGMTTLKAWQGIQKDYQCLQINGNDGLPAVNLFTAGTTPSAAVWEGGDQATIFAPTVAWCTTNPITLATQTGYTQGQVSISFLAASTLPLDPAGEYHVIIYATTNGETIAAWEGMLSIRATPGSVTLSPPDLCTYDYCLGMLRNLNLTDDQIDVIPLLIPAASMAVRKECHRYFDLRTGITDFLDVALDGTVRLYQVPIQIITRVQGVPAQALQVYNASSSVQSAQAYFTYSGTVNGYGSTARTATGLYLNWISNGVAYNSATSLAFTAGMTINSLASLVNGLGAGWVAQADSTYGAWAVTEFDPGGFVAQGASVNSVPGDGAIFNVLLDLGTPELDDPERGFLQVGRLMQNNLAQIWGPGGDQMFSSSRQRRLGRAKVTYSAGFSAIPSDVQYQTSQLVKWKLELGIQELLLKSETAADYKYELADAMVADMPPTVRRALSRWVIHYA
jgi:hypothetical protein